MAISDTLTATLTTQLTASLLRAQSVGGFSGTDRINVSASQAFTDGTGSGQASGFFSSKFTATTGGITISLADSADPLGAAGDDVPTSDPEGLKLRAILIKNNDSTNFVTLSLGTNALTSWLAGTAPTVRIPAGGFLAATMPAGLDAMNDGSDDEIKLTADTASCIVEIAYIYG